MNSKLRSGMGRPDAIYEIFLENEGELTNERV